MATPKLDNELVTASEEEYSIPLDISDIISICREFSNLGWQIQNQVEYILEIGLEESLKQGRINAQSLPFIKGFLAAIKDNPYFGDAANQAKECLFFLEDYESKIKNKDIN